MSRRKREEKREELKTIRGGDTKKKDRPSERKREERKAVAGVPEDPVEEAREQIEAAKQAIEQAESYAKSGAQVTWQGVTYDLSTTQGWKDYNEAIREAKSDVRTAERQIKQYEFQEITKAAPTPIITTVEAVKYGETTARRRPWVEPDEVAPEAEQYIDALGEVEIQLGLEAEAQIAETHPEAYRGYAKAQQEEAAESYEAFFQDAVDKAYAISDLITLQAEEAKLERKDVEAGIKYAGGLAVAAGAGFLSGITQIARPYNIPRSIAAASEIVTDAEKFQEFMPKTPTQWLKGYVSIPSALLGAKVASEAVNIARYKLKEAEIKGLAKTWEPAQQLPFEEELGMAYPEAYTVQRTAHRALEEVKDVGVLPFKEGDPYLFGRKMTLKELEIQDILLKKAYLQTGAGTELILVPPETPLMPVYKPIADVEIMPSYRPGVRYVWGEAKLSLKTRDFSILGLSIKPASISSVTQKDAQIAKEITRQIEKSVEISLPKVKEYDIATSVDKVAQKIIEEPVQVQRQKAISVEVETPIQRQILEEPVILIPTEPKITIEKLTHGRQIIFPREETKKKRKKKGKRRKRGVFELSVDFKEPQTFKEPNIPEFEIGGKKKKVNLF